MRDIFIVLIFILVLFQTLRAPYAGVLGWTWLTLMTPHKLAYGFANALPFNFILAIITLLAWMLSSKEPKKIPGNTLIIVCSAFIAFTTITSVLALSPALAWARWDRTFKTLILGLLAATLINSRRRMEAMIWIIVVSLGYYGIKGGVFTLLTGGHSRVLGAEDSSFVDNNYLAAMLCMTLPLLNYLRLRFDKSLMRTALTGSMFFTAIAVAGTYSRAGMVGLAVMSCFLWWHSRSRLPILVAVIGIMIVTWNYMPSGWIDRMETIQNPDADDSFADRLDSWAVQLNIANARPLIGGGFDASENSEIYEKFSYGKSIYARRAKIIKNLDVWGNTGGHAAHSIYFEVLGDQGYPGTILFFSLIILMWRQLGKIVAASHKNSSVAWAGDMASMLRVTVIAFLTTGAAASLAYCDFLFLLVGLTASLSVLVEESSEKTIGSWIPAAITSEKLPVPNAERI